MEPKHSTPEVAPSSPEMGAAQPAIEQINVNPDTGFEQRGQDSAERGAEQAAYAQASVAAQVAPVALPTPVITPAVDDSQSLPADDLPAVAADDDLIEKEWVDKAKQIINSTREDPARREKEVSRLQADYLKKRYGKELRSLSE